MEAVVAQYQLYGRDCTNSKHLLMTMPTGISTNISLQPYWDKILVKR